MNLRKMLSRFAEWDFWFQVVFLLVVVAIVAVLIGLENCGRSL
jgi:hypothetical protein